MDDNFRDLISNPNTRIIAINNEHRDGFGIYLSISGQKKCIMTHRHNAILYNLMKDGISLSELKRSELKLHKLYYRRYARDSYSSISYIISVVEEYICEELAYDSNSQAA